jgi:hypothetical protein
MPRRSALYFSDAHGRQPDPDQRNGLASRATLDHGVDPLGIERPPRFSQRLIHTLVIAQLLAVVRTDHDQNCVRLRRRGNHIGHRFRPVVVILAHETRRFLVAFDETDARPFGIEVGQPCARKTESESPTTATVTGGCTGAGGGTAAPGMLSAGGWTGSPVAGRAPSAIRTGAKQSPPARTAPSAAVFPVGAADSS